MTVGQLFESPIGRKIVWTKNNEGLTRKEVSPLSKITPKTKIETTNADDAKTA